LKIIIIALTLILGGCSTVTIQPKPTEKLTTKPTYQSSRPFFLFGLIGESTVDVKEVCGDSRVLQMQSQRTPLDAVLLVATGAIFTPHTIKIWCEDKHEDI